MPEKGAAPTISTVEVGAAVARLRSAAPLVQVITNTVASQWTANVLLAAGAVPAMVDNPHEAADFARVAGAVLVNLGTPQDETTAAMHAAVEAARTAGHPWVLDPVAVGGLRWRTETATVLLARGPAIVRGNASEVLALAGGRGGRGVESTDTAESASEAARELARTHRCVVAVSGAVDHITDGERLVRVANGHPWLTQVTGTGCALGALMAAFAAAQEEPLLAAVAATAMLTVAAERAAEHARGPGSFAVALLDELALLEPQTLIERIRLP